MKYSESRNKIAGAYVKAWGKIESPKHNQEVTVTMKSGGKYTFAYTDLKGIFDAIRKMLAEHEIGVMQDSGTSLLEDGKTMVFVQTSLLHSSGEYIESSIMQLTMSHDIKEFGGQISYMKRYQLSALMGISTEADNDAKGLSGNEKDGNGKSNAGKPVDAPVKKATEKQRNMINLKLKSVAEKLDITAEELYKQIQTKFNTTASVENLNPLGASKIIEQLLKLEEGERI